MSIRALALAPALALAFFVAFGESPAAPPAGTGSDDAPGAAQDAESASPENASASTEPDAASTTPGPEVAPRPIRTRRVIAWAHPPLVETLDPDAAATRAAGRVLRDLAAIRDSVQTTWYRHKTRVSQRRGLYAWDCSGMTTWLLERSAPRARQALRRDRPVAVTYLETIQAAPTDEPRRGWQRVGDIRDVQPGDIFAWRRPKEWGKGATGHVGVVISQPQPLDDVDNAYVVRIVDSTRYPHGDDSRGPGETGFGFGTLLFVTDDAGSPTSYGWFGASSQGVVPTDVAFGRVSR